MSKPSSNREEAVEQLISASRRTIAAFEALGTVSGPMRRLQARTECEAAMVAQKKALERVDGAK